jgi:hypothetical protein
MNRRQLFRNAVGLAGAMMVAPKILIGALPSQVAGLDYTAGYPGYTDAMYRDFSPVTATGHALDHIVRLNAVTRKPGETDAELRARFEAR